MPEHFVFLRSYRKVIELMFFFTFGQTPVRCLILYLKRGETLIPFEVVGVAENGMFKVIRKR